MINHEIRLCLLGTQGHAEKFAALAKESGLGIVVGVWDADPMKSKDVAERLQISFWSDYKSITKENTDAVIITAANSLHKELVLYACEQGLHIFLEKPIAVSAEDAYEMKAAVNHSGVTFFMSDPFVRQGIIALKKKMQDGTFGCVSGASIRLARWADETAWSEYSQDTSQGGIMSSVGGHALHQAWYLFGRPDSVSASVSYFSKEAREKQCEDQCNLLLSYHDGKQVTVECSLSSCLSNHVYVYGSKSFGLVTDIPKTDGNQILTMYADDGTVTTYPSDCLPSFPQRHIVYFMRMIQEHLSNHVIGTTDESNAGVSLDDACEYAVLIDWIYKNIAVGSKEEGNHSFVFSNQKMKDEY